MEAAEYLSVLNPEQLQAVQHIGSPLLILAGAGSGKTRVITTKIAYLIQELGINPASILAVTFTKKAAQEMQERAERLEPLSVKSSIRTFHSFGAWFLRLNAEEINLSPNFTVYDDDDMVTIVQKANPELSKQEASGVAHKISLAKDYCMECDDPALVTISADPDFPKQYALYQKRLEETGNVDFGDLIMKPVLLMRDNQTVRNYMHRRFSVIMVDEYQDSNVAQFKLLQMLSGENTYVCVVGDDDQSIYKFRGAEVRNILDFQKQFPGTQLIKLIRNYRSFAPILGIADSVVSHNTDRLGKTLTAERGKGNKKPELVFLSNQDDEAAWVSQTIKQAAKLGVPFSDWAILYRTNAQSLEFETEFLHKKIPYTVVGSLKFYEREEIKDIVAYLSFLSNPRDEISFRRIVNKPSRTVGSVSQDKIISLYQKNKIEGSPYTILDACIDALKILPKKSRDGLNEFIELIQNARVEIGMSSLSSTEVLAAMKVQEALVAKEIGIEKEFTEKLVSDSVSINGETQSGADKKEKIKKLSDFIDKLIEKSHIKNYHESQDEISGTQRVLNLQELVNSAVLYDCTPLGLCDFLDHIELDRSLENLYGEDNEDAVTLITLHNTKGLEFPRVIITGLEYGVFPRRDKVDDELEEERRLFYVGLTRAQNELYLTSCTMRRLYGRTDFMDPSPFLSEIQPEQIDISGKVPYAFKKGLAYFQNQTGLKTRFGKSLDDLYSKKNTAIENDIAEIAEKWQKGKKVYHDDYGYGMIIRANSDDAEYVITVQFENGAVRRFMPKYNANRLMIVKE